MAININFFRRFSLFFSKNIRCFVDLFCGGCDVIINTEASIKYANDINIFVIDIFKAFQRYSPEYILKYIESTINLWKFSRKNNLTFNAFREYYNTTKHPLDLYVLMCFSFNYQFRFNAKHEYNNFFGKNRSCFNERMRKNLTAMLSRLINIKFTAEQFQNFDFSVLQSGDFLYADPPYLISCCPYTDGKSGFTGWNEKEEHDLYCILSDLNKHGVRFALSNVLEHKGKTNTILLDWCRGNNYRINNILSNYKNCNYTLKKSAYSTREVLVTNY